jgi:hypothetical protein
VNSSNFSSHQPVPDRSVEAPRGLSRSADGREGRLAGRARPFPRSAIKTPDCELILPSGPHREGPLTAQGHPRAIFKRAIERGNVTMAEATAREFALSLEEALQLVLLYAASCSS